MGLYNVKITETYIYNIPVEANNEKEALSKIKEDYENPSEKYEYVADATTFEDAKFKVEKIK